MATATKNEKPDKKEAFKAETPAQFARAISADPKAVRRFLRSKGIRVSDNKEAFDNEAKTLVWDKWIEGKGEPKEKEAKGKQKAASK